MQGNNMLKNIKQLAAISIAALLQINSALANDVPRIVPALNCPEGQICCPAQVYCSYHDGCGETGSWWVDGQGVTPFEGVKQFMLTAIKASVSRSSSSYKYYWYYCEYGDIRLLDVDYKLNGDWQYSGFGDTYAQCKSNDPAACTATKAPDVYTGEEVNGQAMKRPYEVRK
jgi:hypothetical protein